MTRAMKDSGIEWIGEIPKDWDLMRLQFCLNEIKEKNLPVKSEQVLSLVKDKGVMPYEEKGNVGNVAKEDISEYKLAYPNTLILNSMNILIGSVGISKYFGCVSPVYYVFKETKMSDLRFINYIFTTNEFQKELRKYANGIMEIRLRVSAQDIFKRIIAYPNKQEQIKIADFLDEKCSHIDSVLEKVRASIDEWKQLKQSVITQAVTKGIKPNRPMKDSGIEWIGEIPQDWSIIAHKYVMYKDKKICEHYNGEDIISLTMSGVIKRDLDAGGKMPTTFDGYQYVEPEDLLLCLFDIDVTPRCVGVVKDYGITSPAYSRFKVNKGYFNKYYDYLLRMIDNDKVFVHLAKNLRSSLKEDDFGAIKTIVPPMLEQKQISDYLDDKCSEIDKLITKKEQLIAELETYKKSLIYEYVTGKKEVK